jgi:hypothetical protein
MNSYANGSASQKLITVNEIPSKPSITLNSGYLVSSADNGNQWYLNNSAISNAIEKTAIPSSVGSYTVIVTLNGCTSDTSDVYFLEVMGTNTLIDNNSIKVSPNPTSGVINISIDQKIKQNFRIEILNSIGEIILSNKHKQTTTHLKYDMNKYPSGVYFIHFYIGNKLKIVKIIKN